ncbi:MAG: hypothetical protein Roseis2KO_23030 [Roseivirga sp.]
MIQNCNSRRQNDTNSEMNIEMLNKKRLRNLSFWGIMMACLGNTSFSNYPMVGNIIAVAGLFLLIALKVIMWRNREKLG